MNNIFTKIAVNIREFGIGIYQMVVIGMIFSEMLEDKYNIKSTSIDTINNLYGHILDVNGWMYARKKF